jgi:hypothetical protein
MSYSFAMHQTPRPLLASTWHYSMHHEDHGVQQRLQACCIRRCHPCRYWVSLYRAEVLYLVVAANIQQEPGRLQKIWRPLQKIRTELQVRQMKEQNSPTGAQTIQQDPVPRMCGHQEGAPAHVWNRHMTPRAEEQLRDPHPR